MSFLKKIIGWTGVVGISTAIALPISAQFYPPYVLFQRYPDANYPYRNSKNNLIDTLAKDSQFKNLSAELSDAGLTETLKSGNYTIFAPTDEAFDALPDEIFDKFSQPENRLKVLQYHLVAGEVTKENVDRGKVETLAGEEIAIANKDGKVKINDANAKHPSTRASNGVIIEIDRVLLPPGF